MTENELFLILPVACLSVYALFTLLLVPSFEGNGRWLGYFSLIGIGMTGFTLYRQWTYWMMAGAQQVADGMLYVDGLGLFFSFLLLVIGALSILYSMTFLERESADLGEFYPLVLLCLAGMLVMMHTRHLMIVLIGLEIFSLALYVLTGLTRMRPRSIEAALKYFLLGAFSSGFMVYGMALLYGATGSLDLVQIGGVAATEPTKLLYLGMGLLLIGLAFKIAIVPFHQWVPDVYQGAPTNVTGFMAAATKTAAFVVMLRFLVGSLGDLQEIWTPLIQWLAILTMTVANLVALAQRNLKRMLAFSSIAHAGYLLIALVCRPEDGVRAIAFYLAAYGLMTVGAFAVLAAVGHGGPESERGYSLSEWAGLGWRRPALGVAMTFFLFSLAGLPPTGGFFGKYMIFQAAIESEAFLLAIVGVLNATIAVYYYLRVVFTMYMREPESDDVPLPLPLTAGAATVMALSALGVLYLGLMPGRVLDIVSEIASSLI